MSQRTLEVYQVTVDGCNKEMFKQFFEIDEDFNENEDEFRKDTLELGFENEAQRCSHELFEKYEDEFFEGAYIEVLREALEEAANYSIEGTQHIVGNSSYTVEYEFTVICINEEENVYEVVVSCMS